MSKAIRALWTTLGAALCALVLLGSSVALAASSTAGSADRSVQVSIPFNVEFVGEKAAVPSGVSVELSAAKGSDAPLPEETSVAVDGSGRYAFDAVEYGRPGEYRYAVRQLVSGDAADAGGFTFDAVEYEVRVLVTNAQDGDGLEATVTVYEEPKPTKVDEIIFTNQFPEPPEPTPRPDEKLPQTGDATPTVALAALFGAGALCVAGALLVARRRGTQR